MFFSVTPDQDSRFPNRHQTAIGYFNSDNGWTIKSINDHTVFFKGYIEGDTDSALASLIADPTPRHTGNFCAVIFDQASCIVTHDIHRGFPMYYYDTEKITTNLILENSRNLLWIKSDHYVVLDKNLYLKDRKFDPIGPIDATELTMEQCVDTMKQRLINKFQSAGFGDTKIKLFLSGGVDTTTVAALLSNQQANYENVKYEHFDYDYFTYRNINWMRENYWGYHTQIHHWREPTVYTTGGCGDEFLMRGPGTCALWAAWHNIDIVSIITQPGNTDYHRMYFLTDINRPKFEEAWNNRQQIRDLYPTVEDLNRHILDINVNDHQHWHLGNTITFTPFKDLELNKLILQLPVELILGQILDSRVSRELIKSLDADCLKYISVDKSHNTLIQLADLELN